MMLQQLKRALVEAGFEVFRTRADQIFLAERVRENLIMDSGVRLREGSPLEVRVVLKTQRSDFPTEDESALIERARTLGAAARQRGFEEVATAVTTVQDPSDPSRALDAHYEVTFATKADNIEEAIEALRFALSLEKTVCARGGEGP